MAERVVLECDLCHTRDAVRIRVCWEDGELTADLCDEHREALENLREALPASHFQKIGQRRRKRVQVDDEV